MDLGDEFDLEHFVFTERMCRVCRKTKELTSDFYKTRKGDGPSSYSYECKECTKKRVTISRITNKVSDKWEYPDW
jgi:hypothetical protein